MALHTKVALTLAWSDGLLVSNHRALLAFYYTNNEQSRVLQSLIPEFFTHAFHLDVPQAYGLQRLLFTWLSYLLFHCYLRRWFSPLAW